MSHNRILRKHYNKENVQYVFKCLQKKQKLKQMATAGNRKECVNSFLLN